MNTLLQQALGSILRWALMILAAYAIKKGIWSETEAARYVEAGIIAILALVWSLWEKYKSRVKFLTALMPGPTTEEEVHDHIKSGEATPTIFTPKDTVPGVPLQSNNTKTP